MTFRPYYDPDTFHSPALESSMDYLEDMDRPWIHAIGLSAAGFYAKQLVSQPFELTQFLLQVHDFSTTQSHSHIYDSDSDDDVDYFVDNSGQSVRALPYKTKLREISSNMQLVPVSSPPSGPQIISAKLFATLSAIVDADGPVGLWRGINTSCLYTVGTEMIEAWISGFLSASFGIPDAQFSDIMQSADPKLFLAIAATATGTAHLLMSPVALIRAKMFITKMNYPMRSLRQSLLALPSVSPHVWLPNVCSKVWSRLVQLSTPWILFQNFAIDEFRSPVYYNACSLAIELVSLLVKVPLNTFYHRAQVHSLNLPPDALIVSRVPYSGVLHSCFDVLMFKTPISTLYRGWRLEVVRVFSKWGYATLEVSQTAKERF